MNEKTKTVGTLVLAVLMAFSFFAIAAANNGHITNKGDTFSHKKHADKHDGHGTGSKLSGHIEPYNKKQPKQHKNRYKTTSDSDAGTEIVFNGCSEAWIVFTNGFSGEQTAQIGVYAPGQGGTVSAITITADALTRIPGKYGDAPVYKFNVHEQVGAQAKILGVAIGDKQAENDHRCAKTPTVTGKKDKHDETTGKKHGKIDDTPATKQPGNDKKSKDDEHDFDDTKKDKEKNDREFDDKKNKDTGKKAGNDKGKKTGKKPDNEIDDSKKQKDDGTKNGKIDDDRQKDDNNSGKKRGKIDDDKQKSGNGNGDAPGKKKGKKNEDDDENDKNSGKKDGKKSKQCSAYCDISMGDIVQALHNLKDYIDHRADEEVTEHEENFDHSKLHTHNKADVTPHNHTGYAEKGHGHSEYLTKTAAQNMYAAKDHTHSSKKKGYVPDHSHDTVPEHTHGKKSGNSSIDADAVKQWAAERDRAVLNQVQQYMKQVNTPDLNRFANGLKTWADNRFAKKDRVNNLESEQEQLRKELEYLKKATGNGAIDVETAADTMADGNHTTFRYGKSRCDVYKGYNGKRVRCVR